MSYCIRTSPQVIHGLVSIPKDCVGSRHPRGVTAARPRVHVGARDLFGADQAPREGASTCIPRALVVNPTHR